MGMGIHIRALRETGRGLQVNLHIIHTGSTGNCYLLTSDNGETILLDAGVRYSEIQKALSHDISKVTGALITHEHQDHCKAVPDLLKAGIRVRMSVGTSLALNGTGTPLKRRHPPAYDLIQAGEWTIQPFATEHDAEEPVGFLLANYRGHKILYATDTFYLKYSFTGLTHIIIECNYCTDILLQNIEAGRLPVAMKSRLLHSHFSLENVIKFLRSTDLSSCVKIVLVHLSDGNSDAARMVREIHLASGIPTAAAENGMDIDFNLFPF